MYSVHVHVPPVILATPCGHSALRHIHISDTVLRIRPTQGQTPPIPDKMHNYMYSYASTCTLVATGSAGNRLTSVHQYSASFVYM